jgi:hypothetical protein
MPKLGDAEARIMVVEDNQMLLALLRRALERAGYEGRCRIQWIGNDEPAFSRQTRPDCSRHHTARIPELDRDFVLELKGKPAMAEVGASRIGAEHGALEVW